MHSVPALNPVLAWLPCLADQTAVFVPDGGKHSYQYTGRHALAVVSQPPLWSEKHLLLFPQSTSTRCSGSSLLQEAGVVSFKQTYLLKPTYLVNSEAIVPFKKKRS